VGTTVAVMLTATADGRDATRQVWSTVRSLDALRELS